MFSTFKTHLRSWIAGLTSLRSHSPHGGECEARALAYFNAELEAIGGTVNVWRFSGERDRDFSFRIAVALAERLNELERDLHIVLSINKH